VASIETQDGRYRAVPAWGIELIRATEQRGDNMYNAEPTDLCSRILVLRPNAGVLDIFEQNIVEQ